MDPKEEAKLLQWYDEVETGSECDPFSDDGECEDPNYNPETSDDQSSFEEQDEGDELGNEQE
ncbi:hypothetical protein QE152_g41520, partial [Popillia japonica]